MTQNQFIEKVDIKAILKRMLIGGIIGFLFISIFVFGVDNPNPEWPENWRIRPLVITPIVAAFGGIAFYLVPFLRPQNEVLRVLLYFFSFFAFLVALWMGTILGLVGTMWD